MDEFEKIRAFSAELAKKTEEAVAVENEVTPESSEIPISEEKTEPADSANFLENWNTTHSESVEETHHLSKTFWVVLVGVTLLLLCLIVVLYLLLKGPIENDEVVTIAPTPTPVKVKPENPGGMVVPDQDKVIYSRLSQDTIPAKVEKLFPEEEKPIKPVVTEEIPAIPEFQEEDLEGVQIVQVVESDEPKLIKESEPLVNKKPEVATKIVEKQKPAEVTKPVETLKPTETPKSIETVKGEWKVQLFSSIDKAKVEKEWKVISKKQKALVSNMPMQIVPVKLEGKGTYYRLYLGAFETREMASNLCAKFKKQKQDCIPAK